MTRTVFRFREYTIVPDTEPDAKPTRIVMRCAVCGETGAPSESTEGSPVWAARHLKANPEHLSFDEVVTRPYRAVPGDFL
ncbi:hypothetical protein [Streptomyces boncukensis]|uniref:DUF7848 domain-containing protein n=1 Tax=Streptomyces boncukensis TaxID=2711219 RepID=A0A6G4WSN8_9ACTN|nr:hypothetical protein [Streptomyces boncukensis]NGO68215.1 hypothetical protein [Streptomyces boncukensis]